MTKEELLNEIIDWCNDRNIQYKLFNENKFHINEKNFVFVDLLIGNKLFVNLSYFNYQARYNPKNKHFQFKDNSLIKTLNVSLEVWKNNFGTNIFNKQYLIVFNSIPKFFPNKFNIFTTDLSKLFNLLNSWNFN